MANKDKGKIFSIGGSNAIRIPASIKTDSTFPFKDIEEVVVEIVGNTLVIRQAEKNETFD